MFSHIIILSIVVFCVLNAAALSMQQSKIFNRDAVLKPFSQGNALKIISGLHNFDKDLVKNVAWASNLGGASHIDIACDPELVRLAKSVSNIPVCVSAVNPSDFTDAVEAGADMIELGNFDSFYDKGITFSAEEIIKMTKETRRLFPTIPLSVTVPHTLSLVNQILLAKELEKCGADVIQTEGKMSVNPASLGVQELIETAAPALAAAFSLSRAVSIPVMCSSGLTDVTAPMALAAGAKGVGIGSMVNKLPHPQQMLMAVSVIASSMGRVVSHDGAASAETILSPVQQSLIKQNA